MVDLNDTIHFGFVCAANAETGKKLASLVVKVDDDEWANKDLTGLTEFTYTDYVVYKASKDVIGESTITAIVTDEAGKTATATIALLINEPELPIIGKTIEWVRKGANLIGDTETEMAGFGLQWTGSYKEVFATLKPITGANLYVCNGDDFENIQWGDEKAAYVANLVETGTPVESYRKITTNNSADYNDMLVTVFDGKSYLIHIKHAEIETGSFGTQITIQGNVKF